MNSELNCETGAAECCTKKPPTNLESPSGLTEIGSAADESQAPSPCPKLEGGCSRPKSKYPEHLRLQRNAASERYKARNRDKVSTANKAKKKRYYAKNKDLIQAGQKEWIAKNRESYLEYMRKYNAARKEKLKEWHAEQMRIRPEEMKAMQKASRDRNKERTREYIQKWRIKNPEKLKESNRASYQSKGKVRRKLRRDTIPQVRIDSCCRSRITTALKHAGVWKSESTKTLIGCSVEEYKAHIEKQFQPWMTWDNWGTEWEIDHIIPICKFDLTILEERLKAFHYTNCQPLRKVLNRIKNDRMPHELDERFMPCVRVIEQPVIAPAVDV